MFFFSWWAQYFVCVFFSSRRRHTRLTCDWSSDVCSSDLCPCNASFDHGATYDYCRIVLAFNIREGEIEGTDTAGCKIVAIADTPKVMTEGNWRLGVFVDDQSTEEQGDKLVKVFSGQLGGPMGGWRRS